jgi:hypothetical protein
MRNCVICALNLTSLSYRIKLQGRQVMLCACEIKTTFKMLVENVYGEHHLIDLGVNGGQWD